MPRIPGTHSNGHGAASIPPNIKWSDTDPPVLYTCSQHTTHAHFCDRTCEQWLATESEVKLLNEGREWARLGMSFHGVPSCINGQVPGISVNVWDQKIRLEVLQDVVIAAGLATKDELDERYREKKLDAMTNMRRENQDAVEKQRIKGMIAVPDKRILGPDGQSL